MSTDNAVAHGIRTTAGVVTSAAIVMVGVFSVFATLQFMFLKQFGVGLAVAVLVDATVVRAVLLPATMKLLGEWNWYLPRWLEWLPRTSHAVTPRCRPMGRTLGPSYYRHDDLIGAGVRSINDSRDTLREVRTARSLSCFRAGRLRRLTWPVLRRSQHFGLGLSDDTCRHLAGDARGACSCRDLMP